MRRPWTHGTGGFAVALVIGFGALGCAGSGSERPAWELPPPPPREARVVQPGALTRSTLSNGLSVLILADHSLPRVQLGIAARRGAGAVSRAQAGLAQFAAELAQRGAGERDALALAQTVDALGASLGAHAGWDSTSVSAGGLSRDQDLLLELLADVVLRPRFDEAEASRARAEQLASLRRLRDRPAALLGLHAAHAIYPDHRYGLPMAGTPDTVAALTRDAAARHHARVLVPNGSVFYAAGDVDAAALLARVEAAFGEAVWPRGELIAQTPEPPAVTPSERRILVVDRKALGQAQIAILHEGMRRSEPDRLAASLMNDVLGGSGFSSRLMQRVRADEGLAYGVRSGFQMRRQPGPFSTTTSTRVAEVDRVVELLLEDLRGIRDHPPDPAELTAAKSYGLGRFSLGLESSFAVLSALVNLQLHDLPYDSLDTYRARLRATTAAEVASAATRWVHPERAAIVVVGDADQVVPQLESLGEVEIVTPGFAGLSGVASPQ